MDIKITKTGKTFFKLDSQLSAVLLELGVAERVDNPAAPAAPHYKDVVPDMPPAGWVIAYIGSDRKPHLAYQDGHGGRTVYDPTKPAPSNCPDELVAQFKVLTGDPDARAIANEAERRRVETEMAEAKAAPQKLW